MTADLTLTAGPLSLLLNVADRLLDPLQQAITDVETDYHRSLGALSQHRQVVEDLAQREAIQRQERHFLQRILDTCSNLVVVRDWDGKILLVNQAAATFRGTTIDRLIGTTLAIGTGDPLSEEQIVDNRQVIQSQQRILDPVDLLTVNAQGEERWIRWEWLPLRLPNGDPCVLVWGIDLTERKRADQEREQSLALLQATLESTADGILAVSPQGQALCYNRKFLDMWGIPETLATPQAVARERLQFLASQTIDPVAFVERVREVVCCESQGPVYDQLFLHDGRVFERYFQHHHIGDQAWGHVWSYRDITVNKQQETALRRNEEKFRHLFENSQVGIYRSRVEDGLILDANQRYAELTGYDSAADVIGQSCASDHYVDLSLRLRVLQQLQQHGKLNNFEMQYRRRDGSLRWGLYSLRLNLQENCLEGFVTDITERKRVEEALSRSELKYRNLFENSQVGIGRTRLDNGLFLEANHCCAQIMGYSSPADLIGKRFSSEFQVNSEDRLHLLAELKRQGEISNFEVQHRRQDGSLGWVLVSLRLNPEEECIEFVLTDISQRKHLEEELRQSQQFLHTIIDSIPMAIFAKDIRHELRYVLINQQSEKVLGFSREQGLGHTDHELIPTAVADFHRAEDLATIAQGHQHVLFESWLNKEPQGQILVRGWKIPLYDSRGQATHLLAISEDITERWQQEQALRLIMEGTAAKTGDEFFQSCVRYLAEVLRVHCAFVTAWANPQHTLVRTLAIWVGGTLGENIDIDLSGTPCEHVVQGKQLYFFPEGLHRLFPQDPYLNLIQAESYLGIPLLNAAGEMLGYLAVTDTKPMQPDAGRELIMKIFAGRAGAELERKQAEEALRASEAALQQQLQRTLLQQQITEEIRSSLDAQRIFQVTVNQLGQALQASRCRIHAYDPHPNDPAMVLMAEFADPTYGLLNWYTNRQPVTGDPFFETLLRQDQAMAVDDIMADHRLLPYWTALRAAQIQSMMLICTFYQGVPNGAITIHQCEQIRHWTPEEIGLLESVAAQVGIALEQARLLEKERSQQQRLAEQNTLLQETEEALRQSEALFRSIFDNAVTGIVLDTIHGRTLKVNPALGDLLGYSREELLQISFTDYTDPEDLVIEEVLWDELISGHRNHYQLDKRCIRKDGEQIWVRLTVSLIRDEANQPQFSLGILEDISTNKQAEEDLRQAKLAAETANRAKSIFLANMSHELRTPLNVILGFAQLLERDATLTPQQREFLTTINRSGEHLRNLINDVLEMSKIEAGRMVVRLESFDLHHLLEILEEMFQVRAQAKGLILQVEQATDLPRFVRSDEGKLRQVLINLLSNAIKFTETGSVCLRVSRDPQSAAEYTRQRLLFAVEDTGIGIPPEELDHLFQPFVQTSSGIKVQEGTGLGLSLSHEFVRMLGGSIQVSSQVGKGTCFSFDIELEQVDVSSQDCPVNQGRVVGLAADQAIPRVLVVDDRPENRDLLARLLMKVGFEVRSAVNGQAAIDLWESWDPQVIWMDMRMPVMDGYEATRRIKAHPKGQSTVILALTATAFEEQQQQILAAGCDGIVSKPFREEVIFAKMAEHLRIRFRVEQRPQAEGSEATVPTRITLTSADLHLMDPDWRAALHQAAIRVDADQLLKLIDLIPAQHQQVAEALRNLTLRFEFDDIMDLSSP